jgi:hypothetical protein
MLRLKENPREWQKFVAVIGVVANLLAWLPWWRGQLPLAVPVAVAALALLALVTALIQPQWFRGFYRGGMKVSFQIGQVIGKVMLTLFFFAVVTPMGLLLRLLGKDLLQLKRRTDDKTWWRPAKNSREFDRMF